MAEETEENLSMEDILSSIKDILSEDSQENAPAQPEPAAPQAVEGVAPAEMVAEPVAAAVPEEEIIDLNTDDSVIDLSQDMMLSDTPLNEDDFSGFNLDELLNAPLDTPAAEKEMPGTAEEISRPFANPQADPVEDILPVAAEPVTVAEAAVNEEPVNELNIDAILASAVPDMPAATPDIAAAAESVVIAEPVEEPVSEPYFETREEPQVVIDLEPEPVIVPEIEAETVVVPELEDETVITPLVEADEVSFAEPVAEPEDSYQSLHEIPASADVDPIYSPEDDEEEIATADKPFSGEHASFAMEDSFINAVLDDENPPAAAPVVALAEQETHSEAETATEENDFDVAAASQTETTVSEEADETYSANNAADAESIGEEEFVEPEHDIDHDPADFYQEMAAVSPVADKEPEFSSVQSESVADDDISEDIINNFAKIFAGQPQEELAAAAASDAVAAVAASAVTVSAAPGQTLEELVKDIVSQMVAAWLKENMQAVVENAVKKEIERVMVKAGGN